MISLSEEQLALAESVRGFAHRACPLTTTRRDSESLRGGHGEALWRGLCGQGLHAVHLPERVGGMGGSPVDLAVAVEAAAQCLLPGCFVPSVLASLLAQLAGAPESLLAEFARGHRAAIVLGDFSAADAEGHPVLQGRSLPTIGLLSADLLLALVPAGQGWQVYSVPSDAVRLAPLPGVDLSRDVGSVEFVRDPAELVGSLPLGALEAAVGAVYGAEAAGLGRAALDNAVDYAGSRHQFGLPIGSFQAVQHKAARMAVAVELASSAAWGAASSLEQSGEQRLLAGLAAILAGPHRISPLLTEAVTIFGGIGFTWEHDIHLYLRRAISISGVLGSRDVLRARLGEASLSTNRQAEVDLPAEDPDFRARVAGWLDEALTLPVDEPSSERSRIHPIGPRRRFLAERGLITPHWPAPWGLGASPTEQVIVGQEFSRRGLPAPTTVIGDWAVPTILAHGTQQQRRRFAPPTTTGELVWCQLFSEPDAGSDLASLTTRASRVEGGWQLTGQKVWTSGAHYADWGICLARTDPEAPKHKGLSFFLVDMTSPGLSVRPLVQSTGEAEFNEVFLDGVFVDDDCLVGQPGEGWKIAMTTLANERTSIGSSLSTGIEAGLQQAVAAGAYDDRDQALQELGGVVASSVAIGSLTLMETLRRLNGLRPGAGSSLAKVATAEAAREAADAGLRCAGARSTLADSPGSPAMAQLAIPAQLIGGGTVEVQLGVIAERILGMPRRR